MALWKYFAENVHRPRLSFPRLRIELLEDRTLLSFFTAPSYAAGSYPWSVATGDFNGDGIADLAVANNSSPVGTVSILLGNGDGSFQSPQTYDLGNGSQSVAVADFNGDGHQDLAVANQGGTVSILLGRGDGSFQAAQNYNFPIGSYRISLAVGDFNGDGSPDLAVVNSAFDGTASILLGNRDGTFQAARSYAVGHNPDFIAVGDFNHDGVADLAVAGYDQDYTSTVSILLGNGDGTFQAPQSYAVNGAPYALTVADFNGDGRLDLAVAANSVSVLLGNGDGTFQPAQNYAAGLAPNSVAAGDFNHDGALDLAVVDFSSGTVSLLQGNGDGTFGAPRSYAVSGAPSSIVVGDFNKDGQPDLVVTNGSVQGTGTAFTVSILLGKGDGTFQAAPSYVVGGSSPSMVVGDFNGDGIRGLAVVNDYTDIGYPNGVVSIFLGNADGTFQAGQTYLVGSNSVSLAVGDFNGDGILDLVVANEGVDTASGGTLSILLGNGDGTFQPALTISAGYMPLSVAVGDFNGDGKQDIVTANFAFLFATRTDPAKIIESDVQVFLGNGDGTFQPAQTYIVSDGNPVAVAVADLNGDGVSDLVVVGGGNSAFPGQTVSVLLGNGNGTFQAAQSFAVSANPNSVAVGDFNGDGHLDLAVISSFSGTVSVLLGTGDGTFQAAQIYTVGSPPYAVAVGDFNGDGFLDLALANFDEGTVGIMLGYGDGTFQAPQRYAAGGGSSSLGVGDFNGDGFLDIAVGANGGVTILLNAADWGGGHAALPFLRPAKVPEPLEVVLAELAVSGPQKHDPQVFGLVVPTPTDLPPRPVQQWPVQGETSQPLQSGATYLRESGDTARNAQDVIYEGWVDEVMDRHAPGDLR